jgi:hypothetical protein
VTKRSESVLFGMSGSLEGRTIKTPNLQRLDPVETQLWSFDKFCERSGVTHAFELRSTLNY